MAVYAAMVPLVLLTNAVVGYFTNRMADLDKAKTDIVEIRAELEKMKQSKRESIVPIPSFPSGVSVPATEQADPKGKPDKQHEKADDPSNFKLLDDSGPGEVKSAFKLMTDEK